MRVRASETTTPAPPATPFSGTGELEGENTPA
jgi:hypothetical protein